LSYSNKTSGRFKFSQITCYYQRCQYSQVRLRSVSKRLELTLAKSSSTDDDKNSKINIDESFSEDQLENAKELLYRILKAGESVDEFISALASEGRVDEALLYVTHLRLQAGIEMQQEAATLEGMRMIYYRLQSEYMSAEAPPALVLLEEVLQLDLQVGEERAKARLADHFRGLQKSNLDGIEEEVFDIFAMAKEISKAESSPAEEGVTREEFILEAEALINGIELTGSKEQEESIKRAQVFIDFAKQDLMFSESYPN